MKIIIVVIITIIIISIRIDDIDTDALLMLTGNVITVISAIIVPNTANTNSIILISISIYSSIFPDHVLLLFS